MPLAPLLNLALSHRCPTQDVVRLDPDLAPHADHLKYRWRRFLETKAAIEAAEGSLANFALVRFICVWRGL